jgi:hypothetical protein
MRWWYALHRLPRSIRLTAKLSVFVIVAILVLYPKVWLLPTWIGRLRHLDALIDPDHPALGPLVARTISVARELDRGGSDQPASAGSEMVAPAGAGSQLQPQMLLIAVERVVYERIQYAWDWEVWGVMDFVPTVAEVLEKGREDCDGRAVLAASLLRRMGYDARLVSDMVHVWVVTPIGQTMSPGQGPSTLEATRQGTVICWRGMASNLLRAMSLGIAVFPLGRELILVGTLCALSMHPWSGNWRRIVGCAGILIGLFLLRAGGAGVGIASLPLCVAGLICTGCGWLALVVRVGVRRLSPAPAQCSSAGKVGPC